MRRCQRDGCGWTAIAASATAAREQYAAHLVAEHADRVEADLPDGRVAVRLGPDDEWRTVTLEEAKRLHARRHDDAS